VKLSTWHCLLTFLRYLYDFYVFKDNIKNIFLYYLMVTIKIIDFIKFQTSIYEKFRFIYKQKRDLNSLLIL